jgi:hypothetical protein
VLAKIHLHLPLQGRDLLIQGGDHRSQGPDSSGVRGGDGWRLAELRAAQRGDDRRGLVRDVAAAGTLERGANLCAGQPGGTGRVRCPGQQLQRVRGGQVLKGCQRGREILPQLVPLVLHGW